MSPQVQRILDIFNEINKVPRCSKNEDQIVEYLIKWGNDNGFEVKTDEVKNVLIVVDASEGYENSETVVIQGHMDMVCEKTPDSTHDFSKDPIEHVFDGDWLKANNTTLGADNGIAMAIGMAIATDKSIKHPKMELLFTVDEETGLTGAMSLRDDFIKGKILLNIDSEDEGVFTVGCAGGRDTKIELALEYENMPSSFSSFKLTAGGMTGGHSGVDIHENRANANIVLAKVLDKLAEKTDIRISNIKGGSAHNAIARDAEAVISFPENELDSNKAIVQDIEKIIKDEFKNESQLFITLEPITIESKVLTENSTRKVIDLSLKFPHGVASMSKDFEGLVETSNNFATVEIENERLHILSSQRSSVKSRLDELTDKIESLAKNFGAKYESSIGYPNWEPNMDSKLLKNCVEIYTKTFENEPIIETIHAGLECGIIGSKYDGMDMISFGPTIKNPHSPDEKLNIPSLEKIWTFMIAFFEDSK